MQKIKSDVSFNSPTILNRDTSSKISNAKEKLSQERISRLKDQSKDSEGRNLSHSHSPGSIKGGRHCSVCDQRRLMRE